MPRVLNMVHGVPEGAVNIMRPSVWGNQYVVGVHGDQGECVERYREWIMRPEQEGFRMTAQQYLRGKDLVCGCKPAPCHGDVLLEIANSDGAP